MSRVLRLTLVATLAVFLFSNVTSMRGAGGAVVAQAPSLDLPTIPDPVAVQVDAATSIFLALDFMESNCRTRPACVASLPAVQTGLASARVANVPVLYTITPNGVVVPEVAPVSETPLLTFGADKFYNTNLDDMLKERGITTAIVTGTSANGAILYTAFGLAARGYTVVVAQDGISSTTDFQTFYTRYQLLTGPGTVNPQNMPLQARAVTLSRMDLLTYK